LRCYYSNFTKKVTKTQHNYKHWIMTGIKISCAVCSLDPRTSDLALESTVLRGENLFAPFSLTAPSLPGT
jgi:hypothetical protein